MEWHSEAKPFLTQANYSQLVTFYEELVEKEPEVISHYWYLGLAYLLQGQEEEAQLTWFLPLSQVDPEQVDKLSLQLVQVLEEEANALEYSENFHLAKLIRLHIREICPTNLNNLFHLLSLSFRLGDMKIVDWETWEVVENLDTNLLNSLDLEFAFKVIQKYLFRNDDDILIGKILNIVSVLLQKFPENTQIKDLLYNSLVEINYLKQDPELACKLAEILYKYNPDNINFLEALSLLYTKVQKYKEAAEMAQEFCEKAKSLPLKVIGNYLLLDALVSDGGSWQEVEPVRQNHESLLRELIQDNPSHLNYSIAQKLLLSPWLLPYLQDGIARNRPLQNGISQIFEANIKNTFAEKVQRFKAKNHNFNQPKNKKLKIGYISQSLRQHSVGWLSRWLFYHHDRRYFNISAYCVNQPINAFTQYWFTRKVDNLYDLGQSEPGIIAEKIFDDEIDIVIDLDSLTLPEISAVMALKPAPVQATWLGWDASGVPSVDYFIADPYVLPDNAQQHYQETIWRLPQTYLAIDGFEVDPPTLRREDLNISNDAIIYWSSQSGRKRHPDTVRLQMKILKEVPNSYFLIKGIANENTVKEFFSEMAEKEGVSPERLRFLPMVDSELVHRANLQIADVVLDTYPYNGATTTLETLWMGVPLVTRVGEQFAARNSYTFMMNVGVTEGIAWTDEQYVEWGVILGKDEQLRKQVVWKLRESRKTSPLWNAKQFTREMEKAYQAMWARYLETT